MSSNLLTLDVSGRKYTTRASTLQNSPYFRNLLVKWEECSDKQEDGSYFVDADPDAFEHVLNFMRRPSKFPLFWTKEKGFDYALYNKLEAEADFFLLHDLRDWIRRKRYMEAVKTVVKVSVCSEDQADRNTERGADMEVQCFHGSYTGVRSFRNACLLHRGQYPVQSCDNCKELMRAHGPYFDDPEKKLTLVTTRVEFNETVCRNE